LLEQEHRPMLSLHEIITTSRLLSIVVKNIKKSVPDLIPERHQLNRTTHQILVT